MTEPAPAVVPLGEGAWTVVLGDRVDAALHRRVTELARRIESAPMPGVVEVVPAYAVVTVFFDPALTDAEGLRSRLAELAGQSLTAAAEPTLPSPGRPITIPVRYDGPDLDEVARLTGLSRDQVIQRHTGREYRVYLLGFAPGWGYLGDLDAALVLPRRASPRLKIPPGSVAIAGSQTGVYPLPTPGGWHLLGTTPTRMFDPARRPAALLAVGDRVRFEPVP